MYCMVDGTLSVNLKKKASVERRNSHVTNFVLTEQYLLFLSTRSGLSNVKLYAGLIQVPVPYVPLNGPKPT